MAKTKTAVTKTAKKRKKIIPRKDKEAISKFLKSKQTKMEKGETVKMNSKEFDNLCEMLGSSDESNHTVGMEVLANLDPKLNMIYICMAYKDFGGSVRPEEWKTIIKKVDAVLKGLSASTNVQPISDWFAGNKVSGTRYTSLYALTKELYPEDMKFMLEQWEKTVIPHLIKWGWDFAVELDFQITPKVPKLEDLVSEVEESKS